MYRDNRKLLVSVFSAQEAREAVAGGARIIDSEDPRSALGNIKPASIMTISDAVLNCQRDLSVQLSTNIGEDQLLFRRSADGRAIQKSPQEIAGKAAQAALGVAASMGTQVHPCGIVKVGLDGMPLEVLEEVLAECVTTLNRTEHFSHSQVMSVLFAQDLDIWAERRMDPSVRRALVSLREFSPQDDGEAVFDLADYAVGTLRDGSGKPLFTDRGQVDLDSLIEVGALPGDARHTRIALTELFPHSRFGLASDGTRATGREAIKNMVDATARAGADAIMLDTSILLKVARVSLLSTADSCEVLDFNSLDIAESGLDRRGILSLEDLRFFVDYCHHAGLEANIAGSVESFHAQQIWRLVPDADQIATRGGASALRVDPSAPADPGEDSRRDRVVSRGLVGGLVPPEQGGYLVLPDQMKATGTSMAREMTDRYPGMAAYWSDPQGRLTPVE